MSMNMRQDAQLAFQRGERTSPDVEHYEPWLMNKANALADAAMMPRPFKDVKTLGKDNGERFFWTTTRSSSNERSMSCSRTA